MGLAWVGPAIIQYGTDEQKRRFLPDILDGNVQWCTGYSEPDVGSDLASLQCRGGARRRRSTWSTARRSGPRWPTWATWIILLVRTDTDSERSTTASPACWSRWTRPGIEVAPIRNMSGHADLRRGLLRRREGSGRESPRRRGPGLADHDRRARQRALGHLRDRGPVAGARPAEGSGPRVARARPAGPRGRARAAAPGRVRDADRGDAPQRPALPHQAAPGRAARQRDVDQQAAHRPPRDEHGRVRAGAAGELRCARRRARREAVDRRPLAERRPGLAHGGDRRRHAEHPEEHHRRAHPGAAPRLAARPKARWSGPRVLVRSRRCCPGAGTRFPACPEREGRAPRRRSRSAGLH